MPLAFLGTNVTKLSLRRARSVRCAHQLAQPLHPAPATSAVTRAHRRAGDAMTKGRRCVTLIRTFTALLGSRSPVGRLIIRGDAARHQTTSPVFPVSFSAFPLHIARLSALSIRTVSASAHSDSRVQHCRRTFCSRTLFVSWVPLLCDSFGVYAKSNRSRRSPFDASAGQYPVCPASPCGANGSGGQSHEAFGAPSFPGWYGFEERRA